MASLFVPEDDQYDGETNEIIHSQQPEEEAELPPVEISVEKTQEYYRRQNEPDEPAIPVVVSENSDSIPVYESKEVCCNLPLHFYQEIVETMLSKDGLLILGRGLGYEIITANILHTLSTQAVSLHHGNTVQRKRSLVILLNAKDEEVSKLNDALLELRWINDTLNATDAEPETDWRSVLRVVRGSDISNTTKRRAMYEGGGVLSISSRILVVDLLSGIIRPDDITGVFVMHAERVRETSNEAFIINLYRDGNEWGFVKAISDEPESFTGFTPLSTKLKVLRLSNVFLWPRFHVEVSSSLLRASGGDQGTVTEISVRLSKKMNKIQTAILTCLQACLSELRRHNSSLETEYWDMENIHDKDFVNRVRYSLEPQWHRISWTSKQLVQDLETLKTLLHDLLSQDSLSFYQQVQGILDSNIKKSSTGMMGGTMSPWLMMDEATTIISYAKERALGRVTLRSEEVEVETNEENVSDEVVYNLEEPPKWEQLSLVIDDIMHERSIDTSKTEGPILIMCSTTGIATQLSKVLACSRKRENHMTQQKSFSSKQYMVSKLQDYLSWKTLTALTKQLNMQLDAKEGDEEEEEKLNTTKSFSKGKDTPQSKRRRTRGAAAVASVSRLYSGTRFDRESGAVELDDKIMNSLENSVKVESESEQEDDVMEIASRYASGDNWDFSLEHIDKFNQVIIETFDESANESLLQELNPSYIIMYEPDLSFIRRVEIFRAMNSASPPKTYFMYYGTSVEEQSHLLKIRKEKQAFTRLIKEKATLSKHFETERDNYKFQIRKPQVVNTRIAGGADFRTENDEMRVIVDTREFVSSLPNLLYRVGIRVVPCMLTVGDYIISPKVCVERKAIPDLIASFKSGRLYQQCEQMFRYYELPTLLIEFDESKSFSFMPFAELRPPGQKAATTVGTKFQNREIQSKIAELLISFPKLKVIWSSSPHETAQILVELKATQEEPDVEEALSKGVNPSIATREGPPMFNDDAIDILQTIPGITNTNYITVIRRIKSMADFVRLTREELIEMVGEENGNRAFNFINHNIH